MKFHFIDVLFCLFVKHYQRLRTAAQGGAQGVLAEGAIAIAQGQVAVGLSSAIGVLRCTILGEGSVADGACYKKSAQVLAQDTLAQGGDVPERARGDIGRH